MNAAPLWTPSDELKATCHLTRFQHILERDTGARFGSYPDLWRWSLDHMGDFWSRFWDYAGVIGDKGSRSLINEDKMPGAAFFPDAKINWAENMLKRRDDGIAIIARNEKGVEVSITYAELAARVAKLQILLKQYGVTKGDRVAGHVPNGIDAIVGAMAASSLGAIWCSASPDFGLQGLLDRFGQIEPKILITCDGYYYSGKTIDCLDKISQLQAHLPSLIHTFVFPFVSETPDISSLKNTLFLPTALNDIPVTEPVFERVEFNHPLFIMFSSGTTGIPKCIVHGHGGTLLQHMKEHQLQCDVRVNDRVFYFTTCGWMMWNWQITALASGATLLLYDGSPFFPKADMLWDYTSRHHATLFGTGAKYIDALKSNGMNIKDKFDLGALKTITSTGSPLVHESFDYVYSHIKSDVHLASISGGTDIISCFVIGNPISPVYRGEIQDAGLGFAVDIFDDQGHPLPAGKGSGELVCTKPFPSMPVKFWNDADGAKYKKAYFDRFPNIWCHGDWIERTSNNGLIIHGRSDATLNPGGVRIGTAEIYRQVEQIAEVLECIAVGQHWQNDERVILFVRLKDDLTLNDDIIARIKKQIKDGASPRHVPARILQVNDIPRTKSNKIVELAVREVIHNRPVKNVESLANPEALDLYRDLEALRS
jgi:acetoacetyl-CoA synthetase